MKPHRNVLAVLSVVFVATTLHAATPNGESADADRSRVDIKKVERNYSACLHSDNTGVVESALSQIAHMQLRYPDVTFATLSKEVAQLVIDGETPAIRFKAAIVAAVLNNPTMFSAEAARFTSDADELLAAVAARLHSEFINYTQR